MSDTHFSGKVAIKALFAKGDKVLMTRDHRDQDTWDLPGGRIHSGEAIEKAFKREMAEELGVEASPGGSVYSEQVVHTSDGAPHLFITIEGVLSDPDAHFKVPSKELAEVRWIDKNDLDGMKVFENCERALKAWWDKKSQ